MSETVLASPTRARRLVIDLAIGRHQIQQHSGRRQARQNKVLQVLAGGKQTAA
jgi:hypothetical protein